MSLPRTRVSMECGRWVLHLGNNKQAMVAGAWQGVDQRPALSAESILALIRRESVLTWSVVK